MERRVHWNKDFPWAQLSFRTVHKLESCPHHWVTTWWEQLWHLAPLNAGSSLEYFTAFAPSCSEITPQGEDRAKIILRNYCFPDKVVGFGACILMKSGMKSDVPLVFTWYVSYRWATPGSLVALLISCSKLLSLMMKIEGPYCTFFGSSHCIIYSFVSIEPQWGHLVSPLYITFLLAPVGRAIHECICLSWVYSLMVAI